MDDPIEVPVRSVASGHWRVREEIDGDGMIDVRVVGPGPYKRVGWVLAAPGSRRLRRQLRRAHRIAAKINDRLARGDG